MAFKLDSADATPQALSDWCLMSAQMRRASEEEHTYALACGHLYHAPRPAPENRERARDREGELAARFEALAEMLDRAIENGCL